MSPGTLNAGGAPAAPGAPAQARTTRSAAVSDKMRERFHSKWIRSRPQGGLPSIRRDREAESPSVEDGEERPDGALEIA